LVVADGMVKTVRKRESGEWHDVSDCNCSGVWSNAARENFG
jgi:hypothetical protein